MLSAASLFEGLFVFASERHIIPPAFFVFLAAFLLMSSAGFLIFYRQTTQRRLSQVVSRADDLGLLANIAPPPGSGLKKWENQFKRVRQRTPADKMFLPVFRAW